MKIRDRIKTFKRVKASELLPNPKNWRTHPEAQQNALRGLLAEVGVADAVLARETPDGLMLIDGHLRTETVDGDMKLPVLVLDVTEAEADKILLTLDPLASMAKADGVKLDALLRDIDTGSEDLQQMLADLAADAGLYDTGEGAEVSDDGQARAEPERVIAFNLVFDNEEQQQRWFAFLRSLKERYPDAGTHGERLAAFIAKQQMSEATQ